MLTIYVCLLDCSSMKLTGPHMETVHWRSQGGPVQFLDDGGRVVSSHGLNSSEHLTSRVTKLLWPHFAGHCTKIDNLVLYTAYNQRMTFLEPSLNHASKECEVKESKIVL